MPNKLIHPTRDCARVMNDVIIIKIPMTTIVFAIMFLSINITSISNAKNIKAEKWEQWHVLKKAVATKGEGKIKVFVKQKNPNNILLLETFC